MKDIKDFDDADLLLFMKEVVKRFGIVSTMESVVESCDMVADECVGREEDYWRANCSKLFALSKTLEDFTKTIRKAP